MALASFRANCVPTAGSTSTVSYTHLAVTAQDASKLGVRAWGLGIGGGQTVGFGASFALLYAGNTAHALVGDGAKVTADSLKVIARRERIDESLSLIHILEASLAQEPAQVG